MSRVNAIAPGGVETEGIHRIRVIGSDFEKQIVAEPPPGESAGGYRAGCGFPRL